MEQYQDSQQSKRSKYIFGLTVNDSNFRTVGNDVLKIIINLSSSYKWFVLSKSMNNVAKQAINPINHFGDLYSASYACLKDDNVKLLKYFLNTYAQFFDLKRVTYFCCFLPAPNCFKYLTEEMKVHSTHRQTTEELITASVRNLWEDSASYLSKIINEVPCWTIHDDSVLKDKDYDNYSLESKVLNASITANNRMLHQELFNEENKDKKFRFDSTLHCAVMGIGYLMVKMIEMTYEITLDEIYCLLRNSIIVHNYHAVANIMNHYKEIDIGKDKFVLLRYAIVSESLDMCATMLFREREAKVYSEEQINEVLKNADFVYDDGRTEICTLDHIKRVCFPQTEASDSISKDQCSIRQNRRSAH